MNQYIAPHFNVAFKPIATKEAVFTGDYYRITFLTDRIVRLEYADNGVFEDNPTQTFWYREQAVPHLTVNETDELLKIESEHLRLTYVKNKPFDGDTLSIELKFSCLIWRFGTEEETNLLGTARTLDAVDGELVLEKGLMSREGFVIVDDSKSLIFNEDAWLEPRKTTGVDTYFFGYGQAYKECLADYAKLTGKAPLIPRYALGNWWSRYWRYTDTELETLINRFESEDIPLSVCIIDMDWHTTNIDPKYGSGWTGYTWNHDLFKDPQGFIKWLHAKGLKTSLNLHPALGIRGHEECYQDVATFMEVDVKNEEPVPFDIANPKFMKAYFEKVHHPHEEMGVDFWWVDWQQGSNSAMKGLDPLYFLNHLHYLDLGRDASKRPFTFSRWPGLGGHRYPIGFSGDTIVTWESLQYQPYFTKTAANVAYGWWSHDIGGHMLGIDDSELYARWVQFGAFSPINRLHTSAGIFNRREPWKHTYEAHQTAKKYLQMRHQLVPYLYTMAYLYEQTNVSLVTPLYYNHPHEQKAYEYKDQYYFGTELLVAPYVTPRSKITNKSFKEVWLPDGLWFDFETGEPYRGDNIYAMYGNLDEMPIFAKAGAIIPLAKLDQPNLIQNPTHLELLVFGGADGQFQMYEDDGESQLYTNGLHAMTPYTVKSSSEYIQFTIDKVIGNTSVIPNNRTYTISFRGVVEHAEVDITGAQIQSQTYDAKTSTLSVLIEDVKSSDTITVSVKHPHLFEYDFNVEEKVIDLVQHANIPMEQKQRFEGWAYGILDVNVSIEKRLTRLVSMPVEDEMKQAVMAILSKALVK